MTSVKFGSFRARKCHHVIKFVHLTLDALTMLIQWWVLIEELWSIASAYGMWDFCDWIDVSVGVSSTN